MSKEEILYKHTAQQFVFSDEYNERQMDKLLKSVYEAMDEYAKAVAIGFCKDIVDNIEVNGIRISNFHQIVFEDVFQIYLESKNKP